MPHKGARKFVNPIPAHWTTHDGTAMPVEPYSRPGVAMRDGSQSRVNGMHAVTWELFALGSCWTWADREPRDDDIVAWCAEDAFVEIPRLDYDARKL